MKYFIILFALCLSTPALACVGQLKPIEPLPLNPTWCWGSWQYVAVGSEYECFWIPACVNPDGR